jgi:hypothetical protein
MRYCLSTQYISSTKIDIKYFAFENDNTEQFLVRRLTRYERKNLHCENLNLNTLMLVERLNNDKYLYLPFNVETAAVSRELLDFQRPPTGRFIELFPAHDNLRKIVLSMLAMHLSVKNSRLSRMIPDLKFYDLYAYGHELYCKEFSVDAKGFSTDTSWFGN